MRKRRKPTNAKTPKMPPKPRFTKESSVELGKILWKKEAIKLKTPSSVKMAPTPPNVLLDSIVNS